MVNMKASGHQGQRKRRQAGAEDAVTKLEKLKLRPDSLACVNPDGVPLRVVAREKVLGGESNAHLKAALVAPATLAALGAAPGSRAMLCRPGGDFILSARAVADVPVSEGEVLLGEAQRLSLHVCEDEFYEWVPYRPPADEPPLAALSVEAQLLHARPEGERLVQDAAVLGRQVGKWLFGEMVSDNEVFIVSVSGAQLVLRATGCLPQQAEDEDEDDEMGGGEDEGEGEGEGDSRVVHSSHCFRGLVGSRTRVYVGRSTVFASSASQRAVCEGLALVNVEAAPAEPPRNAVLVETSDGEVFPVHRRLLKPCITLTRAVRDESGSGEAVVDVDCSTFDRVLLFLEAANRGRPYEFDMQTLPQLAAAAAALGCRALREACARKLGAFEERVQEPHLGPALRLHLGTYLGRISAAPWLRLGCTSAAPRLHLGCTSAAPRLHLGCTSATCACACACACACGRPPLTFAHGPRCETPPTRSKERAARTTFDATLCTGGPMKGTNMSDELASRCGPVGEEKLSAPLGP